jgi:hypothetical protein
VSAGLFFIYFGKGRKKSICNLSFAAELPDTLRVLESIAFDFSLILKKTTINQNKYCIDI